VHVRVATAAAKFISKRVARLPRHKEASPIFFTGRKLYCAMGVSSKQKSPDYIRRSLAPSHNHVSCLSICHLQCDVLGLVSIPIYLEVAQTPAYLSLTPGGVTQRTACSSYADGSVRLFFTLGSRPVWLNSQPEARSSGPAGLSWHKYP
jgi:hypothetical protein